MKRPLLLLNILLLCLFLASSLPAVDRFERLKSRVKDGVDFYRDGPFTISRLGKNPLSGSLTAIRGFITNDTNKRAVSVQLEVTCYNQAGDPIGSQLVELDYLNPRETRSFQAKIKRDAEEVTLYEAAVQDVIWEEL